MIFDFSEWIRYSREGYGSYGEMTRELIVVVARAGKRPVEVVPEPDCSLEARLPPSPPPPPTPIFLAAMGGRGVFHQPFLGGPRLDMPPT